ncbi:MAG TPA: hypothetical protein VHW23_26390 [Kofleriaceae bacterium]|jgi:hypothetical protein|nr:hypothetical protein [Kofleriaceae bacterium]
MRWLGALALLGACGGSGHAPTADAGPVSLVLDIPNGPLDPQGYTSVEIVLHEPAGDVTRTASVDSNGNFDLDRIDPSNSVSVEATLRNASGAAVGYGRTAVSSALAAGAQITVPVRRPIAYIAGTGKKPTDNSPTVEPATFSDLSSGAALDGTAQVGTSAALVVAAGPSLYAVAQAVDANGALTGPAQILPISTADHSMGSALQGSMTGAVIDGAGSDDGSTLVIGTTTELFAVDTASGAARVLTDGSFARVAVVVTGGGELDAVAIKNRASTTATPCAATAELWWVPITGGAAPHMVATGGFADVAADRGHAYYVDACKGELGEVTAAAVQMLRTLPGTGPSASPPVGRPTALAVSSGQAYIGVELPPVNATPATSSLLVASITDPGTGAARPLWTVAAQQVIQVTGLTEVQRLLGASAVVFNHLEVGAGGDYVALTTSAQFHGDEIAEAGFPDTTMDTEELWVFAAATGGVVQRYRSWCSGSFLAGAGDFQQWQCAAAASQSVPASGALGHHVGSMTFLFGKK